MTPEQAAAFVIAQAACAMAEIAAMQAYNAQLPANEAGRLAHYTDQQFLGIVDRYCIGHNAVMQLFQDAAR